MLDCDLVGKDAYKDSAGTSFSLPTLTGGETIALALRFLQPNGTSFYQVRPDIAALRASLGLVDAAPTSGSFRLKLGSGAQSNGVNTTAAIPWNPSDNALATAINALSGMGGALPCQVTPSGESFLIQFADGSQQDLVAVNNSLSPASMARVRAFIRDGKWIHEFTLVQAPVASTSAPTSYLAPQPSIVLTQHGGSDPSGTTRWPTIQTLFIPPTFSGTYQFVSGFKKSAQLSTADDITTIAAAINAMYNVPGDTVSVSLPDDYTAEITFDGKNFMGADIALLAVPVVTAPPADPMVVLNLDTAEVFALLRASDPAVPLQLEIEMDLYNDPSDHSAGTTPQTVLRLPVSLQRPLQWDGLAAAASLDWLHPAPVDYVPFTPDQILTGQQQAYPATIGDGSATSFVIDHNLGCNLVSVLIREHTSGGRLLAPSEYSVHFSSANSCTISGFAATPSSSQYDVLVVGVGPASVFQAHTHTIGQIIGLQTILDSYGAAIATLESILPGVPGAGVSQSETGIVIPLQKISEVIGYKGALTPDITLGLKDSQLPIPHLLTPQTKFDRELWRVAVNDKMLALGRKLTVDFGVSLQLLRGNCAAEYRLVVEQGVYVDSGTPSHLAITWNTTTPIFEQPLVLTNEMTVHSFGVVIGRGIVSGAETFTLSQMLYGILSGNNAAAPANANFAIRARLITLKTESIDPAKGWISYGVVPSITPLTSGATAQAVIATS